MRWSLFVVSTALLWECDSRGTADLTPLARLVLYETFTAALLDLGSSVAEQVAGHTEVGNNLLEAPPAGIVEFHSFGFDFGWVRG